MRTRACAVIVVVLAGTLAHASSTIYDGVVEKVEEVPERRSSKGVLREPAKTRLTIRVAHSPYSSVGLHSQLITHRDGSFRREFHTLDRFVVLYIDEVPVTREQFKQIVKPGLRVVTMENRDNWYFLYATARGNDNHLGLIKEVGADKITLERPQIGSGSLGVFSRDGGKTEDDGMIHLTFDKFPHRTTGVAIAPNAVVKVGGKTIPFAEAGLQPDPIEDHKDPVREGTNDGGAGWQNPTRGFAAQALRKRNSVIVQAARPKMRVELMPPGYGDWKGLVTEAVTKPGYADRPETKYQFLGIVTGPMETKTVNIRPPAAGSERLKESRVFPTHLLAGQYPSNSPAFDAIIYSKGEATIVDGFYASDMPAWRDPHFAQPGRMMIHFQRRERITPDRFAFSSEDPIAWGTVTSIKGNSLTLQAPNVQGAPVGGQQTIKIAAEAEFFHLGLPIDREQALQEGALLHVYPARPQTLLINGGR